MASTDATIEFVSVCKTFGKVKANRDISFAVKKGEIRAIIGENGAGKSTAMKLLFGMDTPDSGKIFVRGKERHFASSLEAMKARIGMVHQHFMLAGPHSALDNIILGYEKTRSLLPISRKREREKIQTLADRYGLSVPWDKKVSELALGQAQRLEIVKMLYRDAEILILDEPTAVLTPQEVDTFFENVQRLRDEGKTILLITHKMREVMEISDSVTVFRQGQVVAERRTKETSAEELAECMVGRKVAALGGAGLLSGSVARPASQVPGGAEGPRVLTLKGVKLGGFRRGAAPIDLEVRAGEVLGIAGVEGNGQSQLLELIWNSEAASEHSAESVQVLGRDVKGWSWEDVRALGVGCVAPDRHHDGLMLDRPVWENFALGQTSREGFRGKWLGSWLGTVSPRQMIAKTMTALEAFDVRPRDPWVTMRGLSGGNQQKVILAREFDARPKFMIIAQPTRGVDVGAIEWIHAKIRDARKQGVGILLISSELDEVFALSDRMVVMYEGGVRGHYLREEFQSKEIEIGQRMAGLSGAEGSRS